MKKRGLVIVISAPSGAGKTTIARNLLKRVPDLEYSVSVTTRTPRRGEVKGRDYVFVAEDEFLKMIKRNEFLEYAVVYGKYYGTRRRFVEQKIREGKDVLLDLDIQGALQVKKQKICSGIFIFVLPPSLKSLKQRLKGRDTDKESEIRKRLLQAKKEIGHLNEYDYVLVNDRISTCVKTVMAIISAEKCKTERNTQLVQEYGKIGYKVMPGERQNFYGGLIRGRNPRSAQKRRL